MKKKILCFVMLFIMMAISTPIIVMSENFDKKYAGKIIIEEAKKTANIYNDGDYLVVEMYEYVDDKNLLFQYFTNIANADAAINNRPRSIFFYNPSKKKIGQADSLYGIRLIE